MLSPSVRGPFIASIKPLNHVGFKVFPVLVMSSPFWDITPGSLLLASCQFLVSLTLRDPEDGSEIFHDTSVNFSMDYMTSYLGNRTLRIILDGD